MRPEGRSVASPSRPTPQACWSGGAGCKLRSIRTFPPLSSEGASMRSLGALAASLVLLVATQVGAQPKAAIEKGSTVKIDYTLKDDKGEVLDTNSGKEPLAFKQGAQQIIPGLDRALLGMKVGDTKKVVVKPEEGYGKVDPKAEAEVPKEALPEGAAVGGTRLMARGQDGNPHPVTVKVVKDKTVVLDLNHPLAGKTLVFDIKVVSIEPPAAAPAPAPAPAPK